MSLGNLHAIASGVIPQQRLTWTAYLSRVQDARGRWVVTYSRPVQIRGSVQPVDMRTLKELGLDESRAYVQLWTAAPIQPTGRDAAPDRVTYCSRSYEVVGVTDWQRQDGWRQVYLVEVAP